jgi:hypothetical protein
MIQSEEQRKNVNMNSVSDPWDIKQSNLNALGVPGKGERE